MTKESLIEAGADYNAGLALCMNNEAFYFKMIAKGLSNSKFESMKTHLQEGNLDEAFEEAHALKGVVGNLALTCLFDSLNALVEPLRKKDATADYDALYAQMEGELTKLRALL